MNSVDHDRSLGGLRVGMVGLGMIFSDTYEPFFETVWRRPIYDRAHGVCEVTLAAVASRTGSRVEACRQKLAGRLPDFSSYCGENSVDDLLRHPVDVVCVATPDDRHFDIALRALRAGKHVLIEKPSVLELSQLDELVAVAQSNKVLAKVVYHKLLDPDHKRLRTLVMNGSLRHVNHGYCSLLEPKSISSNQFSEWIQGRNPGTYVAVHYIKLIDFTFGGKLLSVQCSGQRGIVGPATGNTWDSTQLRLNYRYESGRDATFDIHTSWVTPNNFPGYVEQEVQFRFDNGVWLAHGRRRGVECTIEDRTPTDFKISLNNHYSAAFLEPWNETTRRGYGVEAIEQFMREVAYVEHGGSASDRNSRLKSMAERNYNELASDRQVVAAVQAMESLLTAHAQGYPDGVVRVNDSHGGLSLYLPGKSEPHPLYAGQV
ncbi:MAG: Gfo/Idh/MocA family oxidoreductase [Planctomycetota bacterium]|nr:Gfo/Idh/MocA family oxidoreductase [Planctomycetota bacterium]MDA1177823.1 Gfo/Idh/MocA family oxidoreductase [Planctomycetota bacterium]